MKYKLLAALFVSLLAPGLARADDLVAKATDLLSMTPEAAVKVAVENNDFRFLSTPVCAQGMPGFDFLGYRGEKPNPNEIWTTCEGLMGKERYQLLLKMEKWVEAYNRLVDSHRR